MSSQPDVCIIGGGVIGLTTAYFLARDGIQVEVLDKGDFGQEASWAGAGILPPGSPSATLSPYDQLRAQSVALFPSLSSELRERTGLDNGFVRCGGLEFLGEDEAAAAEEWRGEGIAFEVLDTKALHRLEPAVSKELTTAYHLPEMAQVRNPRHLHALLAGCRALGVQLTPGCPVHGFERQEDRVVGLRTSTGPRSARRFLLATGAWSDPLLEAVGWQPGIHPVRGQIALLNTGAALFRRVLCLGKRYLVPRPDGRVLIGSTEETSGFDKRTTSEAIAGLLNLAKSLVPALGQAPLERCWAGLRPGSPDGLPFLGAVPGCENLFVAAGHFRSGIQLSPATALVMKQLLTGQRPAISLDAFRLDRNGPRRAFRS
ncbi:MAG: glycine oxidase ThiO [Gemmataceae bacterium]|nr:glycine oxidase ThiO [Gemmataceae bacterium]